MKRHRLWRIGAVAAIAAVMTLVTTGVQASAGQASAGQKNSARHVLLISVDGLHATDLAKCIAERSCPNLARMSAGGTTYTRALASRPSDSAPGLMAPVTGGQPKQTGVFYDDSYDRTLYPPPNTNGGTQDCTGTVGTEVQYQEFIDQGAATSSRPVIFPAGTDPIDPNQLPYAKQTDGSCKPFYPNDFLKTNSIFSVAHDAGMYTAWADKHPAYNNQVSGHGTPNTVNDKFNTEINADTIPPTLVDTRARTVSFPLTKAGYAITDSEQDTQSYDQIKVDGILNQIDGKTSYGKSGAPVPAIFGMNFQAVSVGQKLVDPQMSCDPQRHDSTLGPCDQSYVPGGYEPGSLKFTPQMSSAIRFIDGALGSMTMELGSQHLLDSTDVIITAKHGQSPINPADLSKIGHAEQTVLDNAHVAQAQVTDDDVSLIWLNDQGQTQQAVDALNKDKNGPNTAHIDTIYSGQTLKDQFGDPALGRAPDIIVQPTHGTIYSGSHAKVAEHGGFTDDDRNVALLVVRGANDNGDNGGGNGGAPGQGQVVNRQVDTAQVAPTILAALHLDPSKLTSGRTDVLPGLDLQG